MYWLSLYQIWYVASVWYETRNRKFHDPIQRGDKFDLKKKAANGGGGVLILFSTPDHNLYQIVMMTKEKSTKIVNSMSSGTGVLVLRRGYISHMVKWEMFSITGYI